VLEGAKSATGMKSFAHRLSKEETDAIRAYLLKQAWVAVGNGEAVDPRATADSGR
jgi:quinohemoprotein ethanol dehydrogenase